MRGCNYSIEVRLTEDEKWYTWVYRDKLSKARFVKRQLKMSRLDYWDKVRIRIRWPRWLIDLLGYQS